MLLKLGERWGSTMRLTADEPGFGREGTLGNTRSKSFSLRRTRPPGHEVVCVRKGSHCYSCHSGPRGPTQGILNDVLHQPHEERGLGLRGGTLLVSEAEGSVSGMSADPPTHPSPPKLAMRCAQACSPRS
jgi:hypothetical protein